MTISRVILWHAAPRPVEEMAAKHRAADVGASVMLSEPPATVGHLWRVDAPKLAYAKALRAAGVRTGLTIWVSAADSWWQPMVEWIATSPDARGWDHLLLNVEGEWNRSARSGEAIGRAIGQAIPRGIGVVTFGPAGSKARNPNEPDDGIIALLEETGGPLVVEAYSRRESGFDRPEWSPPLFGDWMEARWRERGYAGRFEHGIGVYGTPHAGWSDVTRITDAAAEAPPGSPLWVWSWGSTSAEELATLAALPRSGGIWSLGVLVLAGLIVLGGGLLMRGGI